MKAVKVNRTGTVLWLSNKDAHALAGTGACTICQKSEYRGHPKHRWWLWPVALLPIVGFVSAAVALIK